MAMVVILGAGKVGTTMAIDLAGDADLAVTLADRDPNALERAAAKVARCTNRTIATRPVDLSRQESFRDVTRGADVVLGALSSRLGFRTLQWAIEAGVAFCDISFMAEDALDLDELARSRGVTVVVDCGVAPGLSNLLAGQAAVDLDPCESIDIYVGGLPRERRWPFEYKAAFSPADVIEEYTRPARLVEHGRTVIKEALSDIELVDFDGVRFPGVGTLEAFNTDGLRSLTRTLTVPFMREKTLRFPGHAELMRAFRATGLFEEETINVGGAIVRPCDLTSALLFPLWEYGEGERDTTVMRVAARGMRAGQPIEITWELFDEYDDRTGCSSMSRTTGFPATIIARMLLRGEIAGPGVLPPELLARVPGLTQAIISRLAAKGVTLARRERQNSPPSTHHEESAQPLG